MAFSENKKIRLFVGPMSKEIVDCAWEYSQSPGVWIPFDDGNGNNYIVNPTGAQYEGCTGGCRKVCS